jgi:hypothetical protein
MTDYDFKLDHTGLIYIDRSGSLIELIRLADLTRPSSMRSCSGLNILK